MGAVTPLGCTVDAFWDGIRTGKNGIDRITRFDTTDFRVKLAAEVKDFDPYLYMEKADVRKTDRFVQYALAAASQAMSDSGLSDGTGIDPFRLGVYYGTGIGGFETFISEHDNLLARGPARVSPLFIPKMIPNMAAGHIAIRFGAKGPCISVSTACATGTTAIGEAFRTVSAGYADAVIAGGVDAAISPLAVAAFMNCMALTDCEDKTRASIPFDKKRSGFVIGEGAGALILEEYEHALARGAKIYAEVSGYGSTCDAHHVTAPDPEASASSRAIGDCFAQMTQTGAIDAGSVYFNAHGTSTPMNDKTETTAIKKAFGDDAYRLHISSTKSMTGHLLGGAGAVEAVVSVCALREGLVPPTIGYEEPDEECDLDYTPNEAKKANLTAAMSASLGFGGHNACIGFKKL